VVQCRDVGTKTREAPRKKKTQEETMCVHSSLFIEEIFDGSWHRLLGAKSLKSILVNVIDAQLPGARDLIRNLLVVVLEP